MAMKNGFKQWNKPCDNPSTNFGSRGLSARIIRFTMLIVMLPVMTLTIFLLKNVQERLISVEKRETHEYIEKMYAGVLAKKELINSLALVALTDETLTEYINRISLQPMDTLQLKRLTGHNMQNLKIANKAVANIRFFFRRKDAREIAPTFYAYSRLPENIQSALLKQQSLWRIAVNDVLGEDNLADLYVQYYQILSNLTGTQVGCIEIEIKMEDFLDSMSIMKKREFSGFCLGNGALYYASVESSMDDQKNWIPYLQDLTNLLVKNSDEVEVVFFGNRHLCIFTRRIPELDGAIFCVRDITDVYQQNARQLYILIGAMLMILCLLLLILRCFTRVLLRRLYILMSVMRQVEKGDMRVNAEVGDNDEIGELATHFNYMLDTVAALMETNKQRQLLIREVEAQAMQGQINTHFLYNTLETIQMMAILDGQKQIASAVHTLGDMLRYAVHFKHAKVTVAEEVQNIRDYIALMKLRRDGDIMLDVKITETIAHQQICKLCLQPIVENALLHGSDSISDLTIRILGESASDETFFTLCIEDNGRGISETDIVRIQRSLSSRSQDGKNTSVGLYNVNNRIKFYFGEECGLQVESMEGQYTRIKIRLPIEHL